MLRIAGPIPVSIYPFFWLLAAGIGWLNTFTFSGTLIWMVIIVLSVLIHEYGHALSAMNFGQKVQIELIGFGGVTHRIGGKLKAWQEFVIIINGPLAGFLLCLAAWWAQGTVQANSVMDYSLGVTFYVNLFWTIVNLLPVQPLDGGKLLTLILESLFGLRGTKIALFVSMLLATVFGIAFFMIQAILAGALFLMLAFESYRAWKNSLLLTEQDQNFIMQHLLKEAEREKHQGNKEAALHKFQRVRELSKAGVIHLKATEEIANLLADRGEFREAYVLLNSHPSTLTPDALCLLQRLAYYQGEWKRAIELGNRAYHSSPNYDIAVINALCHSLLGHIQPAIGWLRCAIREGLPNPQEILNKKEFDSIRHDPFFQEFNPNLHS